MPLIPQAPSSYKVHETCQIENLGYLLEQLPKPFGIFDPDYRGRFVEVGAFDGITYSNVWGLARDGWSGIMIEPMPENLEKLYEEHKDSPQIIVVPVACSDKEGVLPMFFEREGSREAKPNELCHQIKTMRLDDILNEVGWKPDFDLLVIDVEDHEQPVLRGFDLAYWRPKLAIIETHGHQRGIIHGIFESLYRIYSEDGLNTLFVRRDWCP
jgi:FkbM family methyltransferase